MYRTKLLSRNWPARPIPTWGTYGAVACRTAFFAFNSFLHKHRKDFPLTTRNLDVLRDATAKMPGLPDDLTLITEQMIEKVFQTMDKKQLDR
jgi:hypothetical protein